MSFSITKIAGLHGYGYIGRYLMTLRFNLCPPKAALLRRCFGWWPANTRMGQSVARLSDSPSVCVWKKLLYAQPLNRSSMPDFSDWRTMIAARYHYGSRMLSQRQRRDREEKRQKILFRTLAKKPQVTRRPNQHNKHSLKPIPLCSYSLFQGKKASKYGKRCSLPSPLPFRQSTCRESCKRRRCGLTAIRSGDLRRVEPSDFCISGWAARRTMPQGEV